MAPCSYVNDGTTKDLGSLLIIKVGNNHVSVLRDCSGPFDTRPVRKI